MRHSEAAIADELSDKDRPLTDHGIAKCHLVANYLNEIGDYPDLILSSSSLRTRQTAQHIFTNIDLVIKSNYMDKLYYASPGDIYEIIKNIDNHNAKVMLISHNPSISNLAIMLADPESQKRYFAMQKYFDTAEIVKYEFNQEDWKDVGLYEGKIVWGFKC